MLILILFAFLGGIVTILSPCILPILPIVLSGSLTGGHRRPLGIITGFILSFTFFTLFLTTLVNIFNLSADTLRLIAVIAVAVFGLTLLLPKAQLLLETLVAKLTPLTQKTNRPNSGFWGGTIIGLSLGLVWTPCVGPIMAAMITLAATSTVTFGAVIITLAYALGTAIPMLAITYGGRQLLTRVPWLLKNTAHIQKVFGVLMLLTALAIYFNIDRTFQAYILTKFPQYGTGLTQFEDNTVVKQQLEKLGENDTPQPLLNNLFKKDLGEAPDFNGATRWLNSEPLSLSRLRGKVVLVDFWTYTCINCIRTLPYLRQWHEKYKDKGLIIVGVHTPEFEFEKNPDNVTSAMKEYGIEYPVVQDNDYTIWRSYSNRYWPAKYLIDKNGVIRYTHFGEGEYDETEAMIQTLLEETGTTVDMPINNPTYQIYSRTPELYFGSSRYEPGFMTFTGNWQESQEFRTGAPPSTSFTLEFEAKDVYLVMGPERNLGKVQLELDGQPVTQEVAGADVTNSQVEVVGQQTYHLISLSQPGKHTLTVTVIESLIEFFAFTFG